MAEAYEVFALRYATHNHTRADNFIYADGQDPHEAAGLDYYIWVIRNSARTIVVDTGFDQTAGEERNRQLLIHPVDVLRSLNVQPDSVTDVILTHLHYDHAGNLAAFPAAVFHLQDAEIAYATGRCMCQPRSRRAFRVQDVQSMIALVYEQRVRFTEGDAELWPGISVHLVPGHSRGLQCVRIVTASGALVLASDACHFYANMETDNPFPIASDLDAMYLSWARLRELAGDPCRIVPGHDPLVMVRYPVDSSNPNTAILHLGRSVFTRVQRDV